MNDLEKLYIDRLEKYIQEKGVSNEFLVSILKVSETYLGLKRISDLSKETGKTTQGIRKFKKSDIVKICGFQFIIDNE